MNGMSFFKEGLLSKSFCHSGRDWPVLFFRKKVHKKLVTVPACHKVFPYLQLATRQGDIFQSERSCEQGVKF